MSQPNLFANRTDTIRTLEGQGRPEVENLLDGQPPVAGNGRLRMDIHHSTPKPPSPWPKRLALGAIVLALLAGGVTYYKIYLAPYETTDDAFIEGHVTTVAPQVAGQVVHLLVSDNQAVKAGDVLLEIDPRDFEVKVAQAQAGLAQAQSKLTEAKAQLAVDQAKAAEAKADVTAAQADAARADADWQRYQTIDTRAVARTQVDQAQDAARSADAQLVAAQSHAQEADAQVELSQASIGTAGAEVAAAEAEVRDAQLNLSYTKLTAPADGYVTKRTVEEGAYVQPGEPLLAIVPQQVWIVANFKETQLTDMRPGQPVEIEVDAYPGRKFTGHVDSVQAGSGARFSLLPPENATGNYVKVVQRVPVKIVFDQLPAGLVLGPGMSVTPSVKVR